jgi:putative peptidoglycan lipid II flippase
VPVKLTLSLGALATLQLLANVALQLLVLTIVGAGPETDAFVAAQALPQVLLAVLAVSMQSVWQPRLAVLATNLAAWKDAQRAAQGQALLLFGGAAVGAVASAELWVHGLFPGLSAGQRAMTVTLVLPMIAGAALSGHAALLTTALRAREQFIRAEAVALAGSVFAVGLIIATVPRYGVVAAAWANLARAALVSAVLFVLAQCPRPSLAGAWRRTEIWQQLRPMLAGSSLYKTAPLVDRFWSSQAGTGGMTIFSIAQTAMGALATVVERALSMPVAPRLARLAEAGDLAGMRRLYRRCVWNITWPVAGVGLLLLAVEPIWVEVIGPLLKIGPSLAFQLWVVCLLLLGYLHVAASGTIAVAAFCAMGEAQTPVKVGVPAFIASVAVKSVAFVVWGLPGLAAATSVYYLANMAMLLMLLETRTNARTSA